MKTICAFAPVNIALIKYMGKENGLPTNSSLSITLDNLGSKTKIKRIDSQGFSLRWDAMGYVPPVKGQEKVEKFLGREELWAELLTSQGFTLNSPNAVFDIKTTNTVPAGTGIATSASGFAALTLAYAFARANEKEAFLRKFDEPFSLLKARLAQLASKGSGSAGRSFHGPLVEWTSAGEIISHPAADELTDIVLMIDSIEKVVASSDAHERVKTSPRFPARPARAEARLLMLKERIKNHQSIFPLKNVVMEEALDMHELFHTASPPFSYWKPQTKEWIERVRIGKFNPSKDVLLTLDAGANVHLIVPTQEEWRWTEHIREMDPKLPFVSSKAGKGARLYGDEGF